MLESLGPQGLVCAEGYSPLGSSDVAECLRCDKLEADAVDIKCEIDDSVLTVSASRPCKFLLDHVHRVADSPATEPFSKVDLQCDAEVGGCFAPQQDGRPLVSISNGYALQSNDEGTTPRWFYVFYPAITDLSSNFETGKKNTIRSSDGRMLYKCCCREARVSTQCTLRSLMTPDAITDTCASNPCQCPPGSNWHDFADVGDGSCTVKSAEALAKLGKDYVEAPAPKLHVIGDTHGDLGHLVLSLLSTGRFQITSERSSPKLVWKQMVTKEEFQVVVLGDFIGRGTHDLQALCLLKRLVEHRVWGKHLVVLLGDHEDMLLTGSAFYPRADGGTIGVKGNPIWHGWDVEAAVRNKSPWVAWLRNLPIAHDFNGVLLVHGGMSQRVWDQVRTRWSFVIDHMPGLVYDLNIAARSFYTKRIKCIANTMKKMRPRAKQSYDLESAGDFCNGGLDSNDAFVVQAPVTSPAPFWLDSDFAAAGTDGDGLLWFTGYSNIRSSPDRCAEASSVARELGATAMVVAHTRVPNIVRTCAMPDVPVFLVDTSAKQCSRQTKYGCAFNIDNEINVGQSLVLNFATVGRSLVLLPGALRCTAQFLDGEPKANCSEQV